MKILFRWLSAFRERPLAAALLLAALLAAVLLWYVFELPDGFTCAHSPRIVVGGKLLVAGCE